MTPVDPGTPIFPNMGKVGWNNLPTLFSINANAEAGKCAAGGWIGDNKEKKEVYHVTHCPSLYNSLLLLSFSLTPKSHCAVQHHVQTIACRTCSALCIREEQYSPRFDTSIHAVKTVTNPARRSSRRTQFISRPHRVGRRQSGCKHQSECSSRQPRHYQCRSQSVDPRSQSHHC